MPWSQVRDGSIFSIRQPDLDFSYGSNIFQEAEIRNFFQYMNERRIQWTIDTQKFGIFISVYTI